MARRRRPRIRLAALAMALGGCATLGPRFRASVPDYAGYREVRLAATLEERLAAADAYLRAHPDGEWAAVVRELLEREEAEYFGRAENSAPRLRRYLVTLPEGAHAEEARERLVILEGIAGARRSADSTLSSHADELERDLATAQEQRRALIRDFARWARHLSRIRTWGAPTSALDHEFIHDWRITAPRARCAGDRCTKAVAHDYAIPEERRAAPRLAVYDVVLLLSEGGVLHAQLAGPELFSRLGEAVMTAPVAPGDSQRRAESIASAVQLVEDAIEAALPTSRCAAEAVSPVLLVRECDGSRLVMTAGRTPEEEDRLDAFPVVVTPVPDERAGDPLPDAPEARPPPR